jgi:hypothetical protein
LRLFLPGTPDAVPRGMMPERQAGERLGELPTDLLQFLSQRLGMEQGSILALLGKFLLEFEPSPRTSGGQLSHMLAASGSPHPS